MRSGPGGAVLLSMCRCSGARVLRADASSTMLFFTLPAVSSRNDTGTGRLGMASGLARRHNSPNPTFQSPNLLPKLSNACLGTPSRASITLAPSTWAGTAAREPPNLPTGVRLRGSRSSGPPRRLKRKSMHIESMLHRSGHFAGSGLATCVADLCLVPLGTISAMRLLLQAHVLVQIRLSSCTSPPAPGRNDDYLHRLLRHGCSMLEPS